MGNKKILYSYEKYKSHPNKILYKHLLKVGNISRQFFLSKNFYLQDFINPEILEIITYLIGISHDFGKITSYFQEYIENKKNGNDKLKNKVETQHGLLSAIFTYYIVKEYLLFKQKSEEKIYKYLPIISYSIVKRHHGNLHSFDDEVIISEKKVLENQIKSINFNDVKIIYGSLLKDLDFSFDYNKFKEKILNKKPLYIFNKLDRYISKLEEDIRKEKKQLRYIKEEKTVFYYFIVLFLYSILLDADKSDAAELKLNKRLDISDNVVDEYRVKKFSVFDEENKNINYLRNEIYKEVISKVGKLDLVKDKIFSLNVPTGMGKTLTSFSFALKLRKKIENEKKYTPRIIYALPYLSIIDQNFKIFEEIFTCINNGSPPTNLLLKHHHLSDIIYKTEQNNGENMERDLGKVRLQIEGWNSEIIVTTFMQFFYSIITNRNRAIRKFHNIVNSIIILDEVQTIPHKYWLLINQTIKFLAKYFNTYFILVTATKPLIFEEKEIKPLIEDNKKYFEKLNRVNLRIKLEPIYIDDFKSILKEDILNNPKKDFLIVLNTINSSKELYEYIKGLNLEQTKLYYLSTNVIPKERLRRIERIKKETSRKIIISTQLIEAGVDISADIVYRDFAVIDSIIQVAGRCNRNFKKEQGIINIFVLKQNINGREYYPHSIYENFIINKTKELFTNKDKQFKEKEFFTLTNEYFNKIKSGKSDDQSEEILRIVQELKFQEISIFKLIQESYYKVDVFVEIDAKAQEVWEKYNNIYQNNEKHIFEKKNEFLKIKKDFYEYVISIPEKYKNILTYFDEYNEIGYISFDELDKLYSKETGFKGNEIENDIIIV